MTDSLTRTVWKAVKDRVALTVEYANGKPVWTYLNLSSPENTFGNTQPSDRNRGLYPDTSIEFQYKTHSIGKIGPRGLELALGGMVGKERVTYQYPANHYRSTPLRKWSSSFYGYIPIIPEKANNKTGSLALTGGIFLGQGLNIYLPAYPAAAYDRPADASITGTPVMADPTLEVRYPLTSGGWSSLIFYYTDKLFSNLLFGWQKNSLSQRYIDVNAGSVRYLQNWIFNVMYDVSPAIRFGAEYTRIMGSYAGWTATGKPSGTLNAVRLGAYYYF